MCYVNNVILVSRSVWHVHLVVPEVSDISSSLPGFVYYGVLFIVFHRFFYVVTFIVTLH